MTAVRAHKDPAVSPRRGRGRILPVILGLIVVYLIFGFLRAPAVAHDYIVSSESPKQVTDLTTSTFPVIPPFWVVSVQATITESTGAHYISGRILGVEPLTGLVFGLGAG